MRGRFLVVALAIIAAPGSAHAGRTFYGWLYGTEVMPERGAELMTWVSEENRKSAEDNGSETNWWVGPLIGVTDQLELALPIEIAWSASDVPGSARTSLDKYGIEARYRLVTQDPVDAPAFVPLIRVAVKRLVTERDTARPEADLVGSYQTGRVHALVDLGMIGEINSNDHHFEFHPGAGVSIEAVGDLRLGAEVYAELTLDSNGKSWAIVGPNLSWSHGRTWISAAFGIGIYQIKDAPKVQWGIAF
ncbi:MAG: hypothetical protein JWO36_1156 [Myxococcales bacterium]|nr:hypothetical protein [Myxococcales bacterium]